MGPKRELYKKLTGGIDPPLDKEYFELLYCLSLRNFFGGGTSMKNKARLTRISAILGAAFFLSVLSSAAPVAWLSGAQDSVAIAGMGPELGVLPAKVEYKRRVQAFISGSGFKPNQEIGIRIMMGGVLSDISYLIKPRPIANDNGAFASVWTLNREIRRKLLTIGSHDLTAVDEDGNELAMTKLTFKKAASKKKKK